ncbi:uncharacterized protein SAPINGB_P004759 [Magnusiomyces paraingens]|uniref:Ribonucleases P/MRP subunit Pop8-like domain-containing protein n=1 Tax=Magnusiomyces paraingens TaxID=2606893 RepID=A0A5E8BYW4_9ASCO|nr:uncharacterized protein SAPINGB_P004759 [Saprochaete ingens]VVT55829.1 unnamed protein product [Saprochaete ingens]
MSSTKTLSSKPSISNFSSDSNTTTPFVLPESFKMHIPNRISSSSTSSASTFAASSTDYAYLHLELVSNSTMPSSQNLQRSHKHIDLDMICWKIIVTKALSHYMGLSGEAIQADIIHIINPQHVYKRTKSVIVPSTSRSTLNVHSRRPHRRYLPSNGSLSSLSDLSDNGSDTSSTTVPCSIAHYYRSRRESSVIALDQQNAQEDDDATPKPQVWIRVPEQDLTNAWTALSGFVTTIDTGNYGSLHVGVRVIRASRYLSSISGPLRSKW